MLPEDLTPIIAEIELAHMEDPGDTWHFALHADGIVTIGSSGHDSLWLTADEWHRLEFAFDEARNRQAERLVSHLRQKLLRENPMPCKCSARIVTPERKPGDPLLVEETMTLTHDPPDLHARAAKMQVALEAIIIWCVEGDKRSDWPPTIASIARAALA